MTANKTVLVLGGGVGGLVAANRLRKRLPSRVRVILVDRERQHVFQPSLLWIASGARAPHQIQRPLTELAHRGVEVRIGAQRLKIGSMRRTQVVTCSSHSSSAPPYSSLQSRLRKISRRFTALAKAVNGKDVPAP